jgi:hypothetical protein
MKEWKKIQTPFTNGSQKACVGFTGKVNEKKRMTVTDLFPNTIQLINQYAAEDFRIFGYKMVDAVKNLKASSIGRGLLWGRFGQIPAKTW